MTDDLIARRLRSHRLVGTGFGSPVEAVRWFGAVQSQDYSGAKWALAQRSRRTTDAELDRLFDSGAIVRTHVLRPTWHFALPEDIGWMLELSGPRVRQGIAGRHRQLELDGTVIARSLAVFEKSLGDGQCLTRAEMGKALVDSGIAWEGQQLPHLLLVAELEGVIISGPRRGKEFTWALMENRVPRTRKLDRDPAVAELTRRYFVSHGPAQLRDFIWWSGLTTAEAKAGIAAIGEGLQHETVGGKQYWYDGSASVEDPQDMACVAHLLPNFDEYTVAYRDRSALHPDAPLDSTLFSFGNILSNVVVLNGVARGAWRRTSTGSIRQVEVRLSDELKSDERDAVENAARDLGCFLETRVELAFRS
jgi:hypothetical protein